MYRGGKDGVFSVLESFIFLACLLIIAPTLPAQNFQPQPVSEYAEKSGPNTITFLSYSKYYTDSKGQLTPVITDLAASKSPDWDFEVTTGIWTLRVRADGTFQAEHAGNAFTYRLAQIGVGRSEAFQPFEWGEPNWKNYQVVGDSIRWYDVFSDVDLIVRYIHDILKVDVIVKSNLMNQIRAEVKKGSLNADDYLTARFNIPNVWITTEARLGGEKADIYTERLDLQQPLEFVKDGKIVQRLRPVETHVLDAKGELIISFDEENAIRSAQTWRLKKDASGVAEMSANLGDLARAPEGDVAIDPSTLFNPSNRDTKLSSGDGPYGTDGIVNWHGSTFDHRLLFGFDVSALPSYSYVDSSAFEFKIYQNQTSSDAAFTGYKVTTSWEELTADWDTPWNTYGGDFDNGISTGNKVIPYDTEGWYSCDISNILNSHLNNSENDVKTKGILLRRNSSYDGSSIRIYTNNAANSTDKPKLTVNYTTVHKMTFYKHNSLYFDINTADSWIYNGNSALQSDDSTLYVTDYVAKAKMERSGNLSMPGDISSNLTVISNINDANQIFSLLSSANGEHKVYVVGSITINGNPCYGYSKIGDYNNLGDRIIIVTNPVSTTLTHELGHNVGIYTHTPQTEDYIYHIMYPSGGANQLMLRSSDVGYFESKIFCGN